MRHMTFPSAGSLVLLSLVLAGCGSPAHSPNTTNGPLRVFTSSPPSLAALLPNSAPANSVPFTMEVDGKNFLPDAVVFWNGAPASTAFVNSQQVLVSLTSTNLMLSGMVRVYVRTGGLNSNTVQFDLQ